MTTLARARVLRSQMVAISAVAGAVSASDLMVDTVSRSCLDSECIAAQLGVGLGAYLAGTLVARRFVVTGSELCGVQVDDADLDLSSGLIEQAQIGACVQVPRYDLDRLTADVVYRDNAANLEATELPVPMPIPSI